MEKYKETIRILEQYTNDEQRETILKGLSQLFVYEAIKDFNPDLHYAYIRLRDKYPLETPK